MNTKHIPADAADQSADSTAALMAGLRANRTAALMADPTAAAAAALTEVWRDATRVLSDDAESDHEGLESARDRVADVLRLLGAKLPEAQVLDVDDPAFDDRMLGRPGEARVGLAPATVTDATRPWSVPLPGYAPLDITPPELRGPEGLAAAVAQGWAEPYATPADVPDWTERQASALLPFDLDEHGRPLNPTGRTGRTGRNLGKWGENTAADPIVIAGVGADRRILLIKRDDVFQWAVPGGMVNPGELAKQALVRELREETGVDLAELTPHVLGSRYVDDWRNSDHAWVVTTVAVFTLPTEVTATAADDAADAQWLPFCDLPALEAALAAQGQQLYPAHRPLLALALEYLDSAAV